MNKRLCLCEAPAALSVFLFAPEPQCERGWLKVATGAELPFPGWLHMAAESWSMAANE